MRHVTTLRAIKRDKRMVYVAQCLCGWEGTVRPTPVSAREDGVRHWAQERQATG